MEIKFTKYHGTGNDFIVIDNMSNDISLSKEQVQLLCHRHFGIGSDGIILLEPNDDVDFYMNFYNPDASQSFCGNGSRCAVKFAFELGIVQEKCVFKAIDGIHYGKVIDDKISIKMKDVEAVKKGIDHYFIHTGSPHHVVFVDDVDAIDVVSEGRNIRYSETYQPDGTNVDFVMYDNDGVRVRIYERGVEDETFSSGTGTTAIALATFLDGKLNVKDQCTVHTRGGDVLISFLAENDGTFRDIWMTGPAQKVFTGSTELPC